MKHFGKLLSLSCWITSLVGRSCLPSKPDFRWTRQLIKVEWQLPWWWFSENICVDAVVQQKILWQPFSDAFTCTCKFSNNNLTHDSSTPSCTFRGCNLQKSSTQSDRTSQLLQRVEGLWGRCWKSTVEPSPRKAEWQKNPLLSRPARALEDTIIGGLVLLAFPTKFPERFTSQTSDKSCRSLLN